MIATFKANNPYNNFLLFVYGLALKFVIFLHPQSPLVQQSDAILYRYLLQLLQPVATGLPLIYSFLAFILVFIQAISFNAIVNAQRLLSKPTYLIGMSYLLITSLFSEWYLLSAPLIINTILIWVWSKLCRLHADPSPKTNIFNIGLAVGVATFFYYPAVIFLLLAFTGLIISRPFKLPEWLLVLAGMFTPLYFFGAWLFLNGSWKNFHLPKTAFLIPVFYQTRWAIGALVLIITAALAGVIFIQSNMRRQVVQTRKSWQLIYFYLFIAAIVPFFNLRAGINSWSITSIPLSLLIGYAFFYPEKKWFPVTIHWAMVAVALAISYFVK